MVCMELYPDIINIKKGNIAIKIVMFISITICLVSILVNEIATPNFKWSALVIIGVIYSWVTTMYSIRKNVNLAGHVLLQTIAISALIILVDIIIGYRGWSMNIALPIIISVANVTMLVLTIVSRKKYFKYAIFQIILSLASIGLILLIAFKVTNRVIPVAISSGISGLTLVISVILCGKDLKEELKRLFHI